MANVEFGAGKTFVVLTIVAACFAVLWPKILSPVFYGKTNKNVHSDNPDGCCDVMFETDINAIKIMNDLCSSILNRQTDFDPKLSQAYHQGKMSKEVINTCRTEVMNVCGIDIAEFLKKKEKIAHSYKQMLDEVRSYNISLCLRHNFGVNPGLLGTPRRMRIFTSSTPRYLRQERPLHFRPEMIHPALREKGRAIPQSQMGPKVSGGKEFSKYSRPMPVPGMRPPMGGPGHVVPPPKVGGTMSIIMPIYTIGIVLFFTYTVMKIFSRKTHGDNEYKSYNSDPEFRRVVFSEDYSNGCAARINEEKMGPKSKPGTPNIWKSPTDDSTRLGWKERDTIMSAITGLLAEVDQQLVTEGSTQNQYNTELKAKKTLQEFCTEEVSAAKKTLDLFAQVDIIKNEVKNGHISGHQDLQREKDEVKEGSQDNSKPKVKVMGLELMAECEGGQKWSRPATPSLGVGGSSRNSRATTPIPPPCGPEPQNIFLEGSLPQQSQLLVTDSKTQRLILPDAEEPETPVILSSKMTLSLISLDESMLRDKALSQCQLELKSECEDNLATVDSTLLDVDSELIDESEQNDYEFSAAPEQKGMTSATNKATETTEDKPYLTATMSEKAEAALDLELEDTAADVSNLEGLDLTEDQKEINEENLQLCNGNPKDFEEPRESEEERIEDIEEEEEEEEKEREIDKE